VYRKLGIISRWIILSLFFYYAFIVESKSIQNMAKAYLIFNFCFWSIGVFAKDKLTERDIRGLYSNYDFLHELGFILDWLFTACLFYSGWFFIGFLHMTGMYMYFIFEVFIKAEMRRLNTEKREV